MQQSRGRAGSLASAVARWPLLGPCASAQSQALTLHLQERAPCSVMQGDGSVAGLVATPATQGLTQALDLAIAAPPFAPLKTNAVALQMLRMLLAGRVGWISVAATSCPMPGPPASIRHWRHRPAEAAR